MIVEKNLLGLILWRLWTVYLKKENMIRQNLIWKVKIEKESLLVIFKFLFVRITGVLSFKLYTS